MTYSTLLTAPILVEDNRGHVLLHDLLARLGYLSSFSRSRRLLPN
jgi:hypothetical protein